MGRVGAGESMAFCKVAAVTGVEKILRHGFRDEKRESRWRMTEFEAGFLGGIISETDGGEVMTGEGMTWVSVETLAVDKVHIAGTSSTA